MVYLCAKNVTDEYLGLNAKQMPNLAYKFFNNSLIKLSMARLI